MKAEIGTNTIRQEQGVAYRSTTSRLGHRVDSVVLLDENRVVTLLYGLAEKAVAWRRCAESYGLSSRECEIVALVASGYSNAHIEKELGFTRSTLKTHINNIYRKLPGRESQELRDSRTTGPSK